MNKNTKLNGEQEIESIIWWRWDKKNQSLGISIHSASLVMPNSDPQEGFFYPTLSLMIDSYTPLRQCHFHDLFQENDLAQADKYAEVAMSADRYNPSGKLEFSLFFLFFLVARDI